MYYISSYDPQGLWGITDTNDNVEELYTFDEVCRITTINKIPVLGAVNNTQNSTLCHVVGTEYFEFMDRIRNFILKCKLSNLFTTLDDSDKSPRVIEITDLVNKFASEKGFHDQLYLFNKSDTIGSKRDGLHLIDSFGERKLWQCTLHHKDLGVEISKRYLYDIDKDDILWSSRIISFRKTYTTKYLRVTNMEVVYKSFSDNVLF